MKGLSLFSCTGIGERNIQHVEVVVANELMEERCSIYRHFYPDCTMIQGSIVDHLDDIVKVAKRKRVRFIMATPPCQSFSNAGKRDVRDERTPLFLYLIKAVQQIRPHYVLIENVPRFMKSAYSPDTSETIGMCFARELPDYHIETRILNAKDYSVPQSRLRSITLMTKKGKPRWEFPQPCNTIRTVRDTIGHLPSLESGQSSDIHKWHKARTHNQNHILWMSHTPTGKTAFDNPKHYPKKDGRQIKGYRTTYKRIEWDKPSPTITMSSGSISSQNNVHPGNLLGNGLYDNARALTVYEIMLLTGLDDTWDPPETSEKILRDIIGEAVPPMLIHHLTLNLPITT